MIPDVSGIRRKRKKRTTLIPWEMKKAVMARDKYRCQRCYNLVAITPVRIKPGIARKTDTPDDYTTLCKPCKDSLPTP